MRRESVTGCDCGESLARALGGFALCERPDTLASPIVECAWCGAHTADADSDVVVSLANFARRN